MSVNGLQQQYIPPTLDGLTVVDADEVYIDGEKIDLTKYVPYTGATKILDMGAFAVRSANVPSTGNDLVNYTTLVDAISNQDTTNSTTYLNKITSTAQTVVADTTFDSTVTSKGGFYVNTDGYYFGRPNVNYNSWSINRIANGTQIRDLQFYDDTAAQRCLLLSSTGQTAYVGLTADWATASKIPIFNASKQLVSSGVDASKIDYLDNVSSDIQTQLNGKVSKTGDTMTGTLDMGSNKITSTYVPVNGPDLINKAYGDSAYATSAALTGYMPLAGGNFTGDVTQNAYKMVSFGNGALKTQWGALGYTAASFASIGISVLSVLQGTVTNPSAWRLTPFAGETTVAMSLTGFSYTPGDAFKYLFTGVKTSAVLGGQLGVWQYDAGGLLVPPVFYPVTTTPTNITGYFTVPPLGGSTAFVFIGLAVNAWMEWSTFTLSRTDTAITGSATVSGNVGIGTTTTGGVLSLYSTTADYTNTCVIKSPWAGITLDNTQITSGRKWGLFSGGTGAGIGAGNFGIYDITASAYRFMINSSGRVGIKTSSATAPLTVGGSITIQNGDNIYEAGCIYTDPSWGMLFRGAVVPNVGHFAWYNSAGAEMMKIQNTGVLSFTGGGTNYAVETGYTTRAGAVCIGNTGTNYGGGWQAGLMMECENTTEISCHDSGLRVTSFIYYDGANRLYIGRDIGFGVTPVTFPTTISTPNVNFSGASTCSIYNGNVDTYNPTGTNNLMIQSWWGIGYPSYDNVVRIAMDTRTGGGYFGGKLNAGGISSDGIVNIRNPNGSVSHLGWTNNWNYFRGIQTQVDTIMVVAGKTGIGADQIRMRMGLSGGSISGDIYTTANWPDGHNALLISQDTTQGPNTSGLCLGYGTLNSQTGVITCLGPSVAWRNLYISCATTYVLNSGSTVAYTNAGGWVNISDEREKEDIQDVKTASSLKRVLALKPKHYRRKFYETGTPVPEEVKQQRVIGFSAQEVKESNPHCVSGWENDQVKCEEDDGKRLGICYNDYVIHLVGAVQEQQKMIDEQKKRIATLEAREKIWEEDAKKKEQEFAQYKQITEARFDKIAEMLSTLK